MLGLVGWNPTLRAPAGPGPGNTFTLRGHRLLPCVSPVRGGREGRPDRSVRVGSGSWGRRPPSASVARPGAGRGGGPCWAGSRVSTGGAAWRATAEGPAVVVLAARLSPGALHRSSPFPPPCRGFGGACPCTTPLPTTGSGALPPALALAPLPQPAGWSHEGSARPPACTPRGPRRAWVVWGGRRALRGLADEHGTKRLTESETTVRWGKKTQHPPRACYAREVIRGVGRGLARQGCGLAGGRWRAEARPTGRDRRWARFGAP